MGNQEAAAPQLPVLSSSLRGPSDTSELSASPRQRQLWESRKDTCRVIALFRAVQQRSGGTLMPRWRHSTDDFG